MNLSFISSRSLMPRMRNRPTRRAVQKPARRTPIVAKSSVHGDLRARLTTLADPKYQAWHSNYLRNEVPVLGVRMPAIRKTVQAWVRDHNLSSDPSAKRIALDLFAREYEEEKLAGVLVLHEVLQPLCMIKKADLTSFAKLFDDGDIAYWNSCDWFCVKVLAQLVHDEGREAMHGIAAWKDAENLWRARASVVGLLGVVNESEGRKLLLECCSTVVKREERWAKSAVGWALREMVKVSKGEVTQFMEDHLQSLNLECVKNATKSFADSEKKKWIERVKINGGG